MIHQGYMPDTNTVLLAYVHIFIRTLPLFTDQPSVYLKIHHVRASITSKPAKTRKGNTLHTKHLEVLVMAVCVSLLPSCPFIVDFLLQNAKKSIEIRCHTPSRPNRSFVIWEDISPEIVRMESLFGNRKAM